MLVRKVMHLKRLSVAYIASASDPYFSGEEGRVQLAIGNYLSLFMTIYMYQNVMHATTAKTFQ
jgi:hypothetical protein